MYARCAWYMVYVGGVCMSVVYVCAHVWCACGACMCVICKCRVHVCGICVCTCVVCMWCTEQLWGHHSQSQGGSSLNCAVHNLLGHTWQPSIYLHCTNIEGFNFGCLSLLFKDGQSIYIN